MNFPRLLSLRSVVLAVSLTAMNAQAADSAVDLTSQENQISYSIGVNIGQNLAGQGIMGAINLDAFFEGIRDVVTGEPQLTMDEMMAALEAFRSEKNSPRTFLAVRCAIGTNSGTTPRPLLPAPLRPLRPPRSTL